MLTHHLQDTNGELFTLKSRTNSFNGKLSSKLDADGSYSSEKHRQSKREKLEMEISRILERNDGKLFIVRQERNYGLGGREGQDGVNLDEYTQEGSCYDTYAYGNLFKRDRPIFKIKFKPRQSCKEHQHIKEEL